MARPKRARPVSVTVYHGADGLWHAYITIGTKPNGRPDRRHRTGRTEEECANKIRELEEQRDAGKVTKPGRPPTVAEWLTHWCENIARPSVSYKTYTDSYAYSVYRYLIPGLGAHRITALEPEHIEVLYEQLLDDGLAGGTVALINATLRASLNEAIRRGKLTTNPTEIARAPESEADEVDPLTTAEARKVLAALFGRRNSARWSMAFLGLRQGEVLGLHWTDLDVDTGILTVRGQAQRRKWRHGCPDPVECARWKHGCGAQPTCPADRAVRCPKRTARCRTGPCPPAWEHGCADPAACSAGQQPRGCRRRRRAHCRIHRRECPPPCPAECTAHAAWCPDRHSGGIVIDDGSERAERRRNSRRRIRTKTKASDRRMALPDQLLAELVEHRRAQVTERLAAGSEWRDNGLMFTTVTGGPIDASRDWAEWKRILNDADVRDAGGTHVARHTAATMLLVKGVDRRVVMAIMGWSNTAMLKRYQHVADELLHESASRLGAELWGDPDPRSATDHATMRGRRVG